MTLIIIDFEWGQNHLLSRIEHTSWFPEYINEPKEDQFLVVKKKKKNTNHNKHFKLIYKGDTVFLINL